jgi:hypothetical protein
VGDEIMRVEIVVDSMAMMKAKIPLSGVERETNLVLKTLFSMVMVLWFAKSSVLLGIGFFSYIRSHAKEFVEGAYEAQKGMHRAAWVLYLVPRGSPGLLLKLRLILSHKHFCGIFPPNLFPFVFCMKKTEMRFC